jgi:TIR domain
MTLGKVFINYRHDDSGGDARHIYDRLRQHFPGRVFLDAGVLRPGEDFEKAIRAELRDCAAFLVVIGKRWLEPEPGSTRRRLDDPRDLLRIEIATALARPKLPLIPVVVADAHMPKEEELPEDLRALHRHHAITFADADWDYNLEKLVQALQAALGTSAEALPTVDVRPPAAPAPAAPPAAALAPAPPARERSVVGLVAVVALVAMSGLVAVAVCIGALDELGSRAPVVPPALHGMWHYSDAAANVGGLVLGADSSFQITASNAILVAGRWGVEPGSGAMMLDGSNLGGILVRCRLAPQDPRFLTFMGPCQSAAGQLTIATVRR